MSKFVCGVCSYFLFVSIEKTKPASCMRTKICRKRKTKRKRQHTRERKKKTNWTRMIREKLIKKLKRIEENIKLRRIQHRERYFADAARALSSSICSIFLNVEVWMSRVSSRPFCILYTLYIIHIVKKYCNEKHILRWYIWIWNIIHFIRHSTYICIMYM